MRAWRNHLSRVPTWMPKSLAICTKVMSGSRSNATRTTSWRNSSGYLLGITTSFQASSRTSQIRCHLPVQQSRVCGCGWGLVCSASVAVVWQGVPDSLLEGLGLDWAGDVLVELLGCLDFFGCFLFVLVHEFVGTDLGGLVLFFF